MSVFSDNTLECLQDIVGFENAGIHKKSLIEYIGIIIFFFSGMTDSEARFRNMVTLGTLLEMESSNNKEAKKLDAKEKVEAAKMLDTTDKVLKCANALLQRL